MTYAIRPYRDGDEEALSALSLAAINVVGAHGYSREQVDAWASRHGGAAMYRKRSSAGHMIFVAVDEADTPVAYALLEPDGHLDRLYNHPDHTRQGLAQRLLAEAEEHARTLMKPRSPHFRCCVEGEGGGNGTALEALQTAHQPATQCLCR